MNDDDYMIKMMPVTTPFIEILAKDLAKKYKSINIVANDIEVNTSESGGVQLFTESFQMKGGKVLKTEILAAGMTDFRPIILKLKSSSADAVLPLIWDSRQMADFLKQADQLDLWKNSRLAGNFVFEMMYKDILALYPKLAKLDGLESVNFEQTTSAAFTSLYKEKFKEDPAQFADYSYDIVQMIQKCGLQRSCLLQSFEGAAGQNTFGKDARRKGSFVSKILANGEFIPLPDSSP